MELGTAVVTCPLCGHSIRVHMVAGPPRREGERAVVDVAAEPEPHVCPDPAERAA